MQTHETVNQYDSAGKKHGSWLIRTVEKMGEPAMSEFGNYVHGFKNGPWYKMSQTGDLMSVENYKNNVLDGEAQYFEGGKLTCAGTYRGLNPTQPFDTFLIVDPITHLESFKYVPTESGHMRHGIWRFYDAKTGTLMREEMYQVDELVYRKQIVPIRENDSLLKKKEENLPHHKKPDYQPPSGKRVSYTDNLK